MTATRQVELTEEDLRITTNAIREVYTPERVGQSMDPAAVAALKKYDAALNQFTAERKRREEIVASLTDDEIELIMNRRNQQLMRVSG